MHADRVMAVMGRPALLRRDDGTYMTDVLYVALMVGIFLALALMLRGMERW
jgi:hypothetical protein